MAKKEVPIIRPVYTSGNTPREPQWTIYTVFRRDVVPVKLTSAQWKEISRRSPHPLSKEAQSEIEWHISWYQTYRKSSPRHEISTLKRLEKAEDAAVTLYEFLKNPDDDLRVAVHNAWTKLYWPEDRMQTALTRAYHSINMIKYLFREAKNLKPRRSGGRNPKAIEFRLLVFWLCDTCEQFTGKKASLSKKVINYMLAVCQAAEPNLLKTKSKEGEIVVKEAVKKWMARQKKRSRGGNRSTK